ncbi:DMT family transporter [Pseudoruegeria sp. HB172150]|uniref:DMT family transporter n=1 Tax=Pseudoruegeria sp. HB172150 TaxID=2721164 RepID=UPI0015559877|nr:DMT family transporter [Pseudoruegeria sp. HB172150]
MRRIARLSPTAQGILFLLTSVLILSFMDATAKLISERTNPGMALWARYLGQTVIVFIVVIPRVPRVFRTRYPGMQFLRSLFLLLATTCFFFSLTLMPLADATAVMNTNPVLIALGAALFLGERFGPRRAFGVGAALIGALIIIRPGADVFSLSSLLPLCAAVFVAAYSLATRYVGHGEDPWTSLLYAAMFGAVVISILLPRFWVTPDTLTACLMAGLGILASIGHFFLIRAFASAEASAIAPFAYAQLVLSTIWGVVIFGEYPDPWFYLGALVIAGAGLYVWHRETRARSPE